MEKSQRYDFFIHRILSKEEVMAFMGVLILLGIHTVRNHRKAWSAAKAQVLVRLSELMTCQRFELLGCFLHVVTFGVFLTCGNTRRRRCHGQQPAQKLAP